MRTLDDLYFRKQNMHAASFGGIVRDMAAKRWRNKQSLHYCLSVGISFPLVMAKRYCCETRMSHVFFATLAWLCTWMDLRGSTHRGNESSSTRSLPRWNRSRFWSCGSLVASCCLSSSRYETLRVFNYNSQMNHNPHDTKHNCSVSTEYSNGKFVLRS